MMDENIENSEKHLGAHVFEIASGALVATVKRCQQKASV